MKNKEEKPEMPPVPLTDNLLDNLVELRALFGGSADLTIRRMTVCSREIALVTVEGMVDRHLMADAVILPMARMTGESASAETLISRIRDEVLPSMSALRAAVDEAETLTASDCWPYPTYGDLLFSVR